MKTVARRRGGGTEKHDEKGRAAISKHHESSGDGMSDLDHAKHVGAVRGAHGKHVRSRSPRKGGGHVSGSVGSDRKPFSSAAHGTEPKGRHTMDD